MRRFILTLACVAALSGVSAGAEPPDPQRWRALDPETTLYLDTEQGRIVIEMYPEIAPMHVERISALARSGFFDGQIFHRVIDGFMAQTGDPLGTGEGASDLADLPAEFFFRRGPDMPFVEAAVVRDGRGRVTERLGFYKALPMETQPDEVMERTSDGRAMAWGVHCPGVASMARFAEENSANSQFFLMRAAYPSLDKRYSIWGRVLWGQEIIDGLEVGAPPVRPQRIQQVRVAADVPQQERAPIYVMRADSPDFRRLVEETRRAVRRDRDRVFSLCDVTIPVRVTGVENQERDRPWWRNIPLIP